MSSELIVDHMTLPDGKWPENEKTNAEVIYAISDVPSLQVAPNLRWVQSHWVRINHLTRLPVWDSSTIITSASGVHTTNIAQYVLAQLLNWANGVQNWGKYKRNRSSTKLNSDALVPIPLRGKRLGILGYGSVGREVARLAHAFGMEILVTKRNVMRPEDTGFFLPDTGDPEALLPARIYPPEATRSMVSECDFVVVSLPQIDQTENLINEDLLRGMKPTAFLINISPPAVVVEADLVRALKRGWIAGAGLDIHTAQPLAPDSPLWEMENVILSPHVAGRTLNYDQRVSDLFIENLQRYLAGQPLLNVVNREHGY